MRFALIACLSVLGFGLLGAEKNGPESHAVSISGLQYSPASLSLSAGDTVVWTNNDDRDHTVVAADGAFRSGVIRQGETFSFTFARPGKFTYGCQFHPRMKGVVIVAARK